MFPWVQAAGCLPAEPQALHNAGAEILDQHVGRRHQPHCNRRIIGLLEMQRDAALAAVPGLGIPFLCLRPSRTPGAYAPLPVVFRFIRLVGAAPLALPPQDTCFSRNCPVHCTSTAYVG